MKITKIVIIVSAFIFVLLISSLFVLKKANESRGDLPLLYDIPEFRFTERSNIPFGKDQLRGKISILDFIFTNCPGPCPLMSTKMAELYRAYEATDLLQFVSISVDPNRDSLAVLRAYADKFGVIDNRWQFLSAPIDDVIDLYEGGFKLGGMLPVEHSTKFILVDQNAVIRGYYDFDDPISMTILQTHIKELLKELL